MDSLASLLAQITNEAIRERIETEFRHLLREIVALQIDLDPPDDETSLDMSPPLASAEASPGEIAVARALDEWHRVVMEPPGENAERIDLYIRGPHGLGWRSADKNHLGKSRPYIRNGMFAWCGAFAAFAWAALRPEIRRKVMPSTYRLHKWAREHRRLVVPKDLLPGDIAVVGPADGSGKAWGNHITIVEAVSEDDVSTIEGNAKGNGPGGKIYEGVIRKERPFRGTGRTYIVMYGVRFEEDDLG